MQRRKGLVVVIIIFTVQVPVPDLKPLGLEVVQNLGLFRFGEVMEYLGHPLCKTPQLGLEAHPVSKHLHLSAAKPTHSHARWDK